MKLNYLLLLLATVSAHAGPVFRSVKGSSGMYVVMDPAAGIRLNRIFTEISFGAIPGCRPVEYHSGKHIRYDCTNYVSAPSGFVFASIGSPDWHYFAIPTGATLADLQSISQSVMKITRVYYYPSKFLATNQGREMWFDKVERIAGTYEAYDDSRRRVVATPFDLTFL